MAGDGSAFEHQVALWAKKHYGGSVQERLLVGGLSKRPFEVDVRVNIRGIIDSNDIWIECKDRRERIKAGDIRYLVLKATELIQACRSGKENLYFNRLVLVSTSAFEVDAINLADILGVECFLYDRQRYILQNRRGIGFNETWLRDAWR